MNNLLVLGNRLRHLLRLAVLATAMGGCSAEPSSPGSDATGNQGEQSGLGNTQRRISRVRAALQEQRPAVPPQDRAVRAPGTAE